MNVLKGILMAAILFSAVNINAQTDDKKAIKKFGWIDADANKEITMDEMLAFHKDKKDAKGRPVRAKLLFLGLDSDNNEKLTLEEFKQPVNWKSAKEKEKGGKPAIKKEKPQKEKAKSNAGEDRLTKKFGYVDTDGNKEVSKVEMIAFHKTKKNKKGEAIDGEGMFLGLDANNDDKLTLEEFKQPINWKLAKEKKKN